MSNIIVGLKNYFSPLSGAQKLLFGLFSVGVLSLLGLLFYWALQPSYSLLFGSLSPESAQSIVEELKASNVSYRLEDNGKTIMVPRGEVYDLRLKFASQGAAGNDYQGYELFDQNNLGMTDFMQRINKKRALEGELARTVNSLDHIESSRIHIVMPERSPFQQVNVSPSASVFLNVKRGRKLSAEQIDGIASLISGSVAGLNKEDVVILDQKGNRISENMPGDSDLANSSSQIKIKQATETYLTNKGQSMLDMVLGSGNSILRVSTTHNFDRITRDSKLIDPATRIVISEETRVTTNSDQTLQPPVAVQYGPNQTPQESITTASRDDESKVEVKNYEVATTREQYEKTVGEVTGISAAILLNYKSVPPQTEGGETNYEPYSEEELSELREVMIPALGIQEERGDQLNITQVKFTDPFASQKFDEELFQQPFSIMEILRWSILGIVVTVISVMIYRVSKNFKPELEPLFATAEGHSTPARNMQANPQGEHKYIDQDTTPGDQENDIYSEKLSQDAKLLTDNTEISEAVKNFVEEEPAEAAKVVRTMIKDFSEV